MTTVAPQALYGMYKTLDPHLSSLRIGGVVGDTSHIKTGGYHISRDDLHARGQTGDYSIQAPADRRGDGTYASAIDLSLNPAQMVQVSERLRRAMTPDAAGNYDPRIEPLREFIGTVDNRNVCGYNRYHTGRRTGWYASGYSDTSHLAHVHLSFFRAYCDDPNSVAGAAEVVAGLPAGTLGWAGPKTPNTPTQEDVVTPADRQAIIDGVVSQLRHDLPGDIWSFDGIPAPAAEKDPKTNPTWTPKSYLRRIESLLSGLKP